MIWPAQYEMCICESTQVLWVNKSNCAGLELEVTKGIAILVAICATVGGNPNRSYRDTLVLFESHMLEKPKVAKCLKS